MLNLWQDLRYAVRALVKTPGFTAVAVITLALGIGATTAIFSVIEAVLLRPLPYKDAGQLVILSNAKDFGLEGESGGILYRDFQAWKSRSRSFEDVAVFYRNSGWSRVTLSGDEPESVQGAFVSSNFFPMVGISPVLGRWFTNDEEKHAERVIVLSHALWTRRFGASRDVIGKTLAIDGVPAQIIGVMPVTFQLPAADAEFWAPITTNVHWGDPAVNIVDPQYAGGFYERWKAIGRLRPGTSLATAQTEISTISKRLALDDHDPNRDDVKLFPVRVTISGDTKLVLSVMSGAVLFVLLIACINVANLVLARGAARQHELAMRTALGASRWRLLLQLFAESVVLALAAGCLGIGLSFAGVRVFVIFGPDDIPRLSQTAMDAPVLSFVLAVSMFASVLVGLIPALKISRCNPSEALKSGAKTTSASSALKKTQGLLVAMQFALSVVLLVGAGLLIHTFLAIEAVNPGFQPERALTMSVTTPWGTSSRQTQAIFDSVLERVTALPGVRAVGGIDYLFDMGSPFINGLRAIEGRASEPREKWTPLSWDTVSGNYFEAMGVPLLRGRYFSSEDGANSPLVAVIDENMARRYWPGENPIGQRIKGQDKRGHDDEWVTVIGVVGNVSNHGLEKQPTPHVYEWYKQSRDATGNLIVRTTTDPNSFAPTLRAVVREVDRNLILSAVITMDEQLAEQLAPRRFQTSLLSVFSFLALILACIGIYAMMQYSVTQRVPEIGIRIALGAGRQDVVTMIVRQGLTLALTGIALGFLGALILTRYLSSLLYAVRPTDPLTFVAVIALLIATAFCACYLPARRAAQVDPTVALRYD
jgi:predicted permease